MAEPILAGGKIYSSQYFYEERAGMIRGYRMYTLLTRGMGLILSLVPEELAKVTCSEVLIQEDFLWLCSDLMRA